MAETVCEITVTLRIEDRQSLIEVNKCLLEISRVPVRCASKAVGDAGFRRCWFVLAIAQQGLDDFPHRRQLAARKRADP